MRKKLLLGAGIAVVALLSMGFRGDDYTVTHYSVTLHGGDTVESASEVFYELNQNGDCYDMFRYRVLEANEELFADGRVPQTGDKVIIPVMVKR